MSRYRLAILLASNLVVPLLGILLGGWDAMAMLVFYLAESGVLLAVMWIYLVWTSKGSRAMPLFFVGPMFALLGYGVFRLFFNTFFHVSRRQGLTLAQIGDLVHADQLGWGFVAALLVTGLGHGWRLVSARAKGKPDDNTATIRESSIHLATIVLSCFLLAPLAAFKLALPIALGFGAIRTYVEYQRSDRTAQ